MSSSPNRRSPFTPRGLPLQNRIASADYRSDDIFRARQRLERIGVVSCTSWTGSTGFHDPGGAMTLSDFSKIFTGPLKNNGGYTQETAEAVIALGHHFIGNPDVVHRFAENIDVNPDAEMSTGKSN